MAGTTGGCLHVSVRSCPHQRLILRDEVGKGRERRREQQGYRERERERQFFWDVGWEFAYLHILLVKANHLGKRLHPQRRGTERQFARGMDPGGC